MTGPKPASQYPYVVVTLDGSIHSGHEDIAAADLAVREANARAELLGIKARYETRAKVA